MSTEGQIFLQNISTQANTMGEIDKALLLQAKMAAQIVNQYDEGQLEKDLAVAEMAKLFEIVYGHTLRIESADSREFARRMGIDTLTTDTQGARSAQWFEASSKPFATGVASSCIVCAVINDEVGMAAAHKNTVTGADYKSFLNRALDDKQLRVSMMRSNSLHGLFVTSESLTGSVNTAIDQAFNEFSILAPGGIPPEGTQIFLAGLDYLTKEQIEPIIQTAAITISQRVSQEGKMIGVGKALSLGFGGLGEDSGIIYGGKNHPHYATPQYYRMG